MSSFLRLVDGRTIAVRESVSELNEIFQKATNVSPQDYFHDFKMADNTNEVRRIRLSAIIEYQRGHSK